MEKKDMGWKDQREKIVELLKGETETVFLAGGVGVGKTWMAREVVDHIDPRLFYGPLWIYRNEKYVDDGDESLYRDIAFQLSVPEEDKDGRKKKPFEDLKVDIDESLYREIAFKLSVPVNGKDGRKKKLEDLKVDIPKEGKAFFILLILDDSPGKEYGEKVVSRLGDMLKKVVPLKILVTRSDKWQPDPESCSEEEVITINAGTVWDAKVRKQIPERDGLPERIEKIRTKIQGIQVVPVAVIVLIAEALNRSPDEKNYDSWVSKFEQYKEEESGLRPLLRCCIDILESLDKSLVNCYWYMWEFFRNNGAIRHSELIVSWILEGLVGSDDPVEEAFKEGHRVLMKFVDYGVLKMQEADLVSFESLLLEDELKDWRLDRYERTSALGLARLFDDRTFPWQRLQLIASTKEIEPKDTPEPSKEQKEPKDTPEPRKEQEDTKDTPEPSKEQKDTQDTKDTPEPSKDKADEGFTLLIDGSRFFREKPENFFKKKPRLHALAIFNPTFKSLPSIEQKDTPEAKNKADEPFPLLIDENLSILVLRGCDQLETIHGIQWMKSLTVLEISGATKLNEIPGVLFDKMTKLRSLVLRGLRITELPSALSKLIELRWLILRECTELKELPRLRELKQLQVLNLSGSTSFLRVRDKHFSHLEKLQLFDFSNTGIKRLPLLGKLGVTQVLLSGCTSLIRLPFFEELTALQYLNLSGSTQLKEITLKFPRNKQHLKILDLSNTKISSLPANFHEIKNVERLDLSGASYLSDIPNNTFENMKCLSHLNLSKTKIERLPETTGLKSLEELDLSNVSSLVGFADKSLEHLGCLRRLNLSGCGNLSALPPLEKVLEKLEFLDLSGTGITSLPTLDNICNLRELKLRRCKGLTSLQKLESLTKLEVLDLWGTGITEIPSEIYDLPCLKHLDLPMGIKNVDQEKIKKKDGGVEVNWDECGIFEGRETPDYIVVKGTDFFKNFETHPELWDDTRFKKFHFSVSPLETEGGAEDRYWHEIDLKFRNLYFLTRHIPLEDDGRYLEILGFDRFPSGVEDALKRAKYLSLIETKFIEKLSDLGVDNVDAMKGCWLERCTKMTTIFCGEEKETKMVENLEIVWVSDLPITETVSSKGTHPLTFKNLREMYIEYCPKLKEVLVCSLLPQNLQVLHVKFCEKLEWLFKPRTLTEEPKLPKLKTLHLVQLPELTTIGLPEPETSTDSSPPKTSTDPSPSKASMNPPPSKASSDPSPSKASTDPSSSKASRREPSPPKPSTDPSPPEASSDPSTSKASGDPSPPKPSTDPSPSKASTDPSAPEASTDPSPPKASSDPSPSQASMDPSPPEASTDPSPPKASSDPSPSQASTDPSPPEASTDPSPPKASSEPSPSKASTDPSPPEASTDPSPPKASSDPSPSKASTDPSPPEASTDPSPPKASSDPSPSQASTDPSPPEASTDPSPPKASTDPSPSNPSSDPSPPKAPTDPSSSNASSDPSPPKASLPKTFKDLFPALNEVKCQNCPKLVGDLKMLQEMGFSVGDMFS